MTNKNTFSKPNKEVTKSKKHLTSFYRNIETKYSPFSFFFFENRAIGISTLKQRNYFIPLTGIFAITIYAVLFLNIFMSRVNYIKSDRITNYTNSPSSDAVKPINNNSILQRRNEIRTTAILKHYPPVMSDNAIRA